MKQACLMAGFILALSITSCRLTDRKEQPEIKELTDDQTREGFSINNGGTGAFAEGVGMVYQTNSGFGTGSKMVDIKRCVLTAAHVRPAGFLSSQIEPMKVPVEWAKVLRGLPHPFYPEGMPADGTTNEIDVGVDLQLLWLYPYQCNVEKGLADPNMNQLAQCAFDAPNRVNLNWNGALGLDFSKPELESPTIVIGYGRDRKKKQSGIRQVGFISMLEEVPQQDGKVGFDKFRGREIERIAENMQYFDSGDSGGPIVVVGGTDIKNVAAAATPALNNEQHLLGYGTGLRFTRNRQFVTPGKYSDDIWGDAAKHCRPKPTVEVLLGTSPNEKSDTSIDVNFQLGTVVIQSVDKMWDVEEMAKADKNKYIAYPDAKETCKAEKNQQLASCKLEYPGIDIEIKLENLDEGYAFVRWIGFNNAQPGKPSKSQCPCTVNPTVEVCKILNTNISEWQELAGIKCGMIVKPRRFTPVIPPDPGAGINGR